MTLNAQETNTLLHADKTDGESGVVLLPFNLVDEEGNRYVDESGNYYIVYDTVAAQLLHAKETSTMLHCEES